MKTVRYILLGLVAAAVVGLLAYQGLVTHELTGSNLTKAILILIGVVLSLLKGERRGKATKADYKAAYGHLIGNAFSGDTKLEKQLYKALDDFNSRKYPACLKKLDDLMCGIHETCVEYGSRPDGSVNYVVGANVGGFVKVAEAMIGQGIV